MLLMHYFRKRKIEILYQKNEFSIRIRLKTILQWLINKEQLKEGLKLENRKRFAIVITIVNKVEVLKLCAKEFRFKGALKVVEKY